MKFLAISIGETFSWKGDSYRKTGPMTATPVEGSGSKMIPRSAEVEPLENRSAETGHMPEHPAAAALLSYQKEISDLIELWRTTGIPDRATLNETLSKHRKAILKSA